MLLEDLNLESLLASGLLARVEHHPRLTSTNDHARLAATEAGELPLLVIADEQTAGRGRGANRWWTGRGSLACSLLFEPAASGIERRYFSMISLAAAVAIVETAAPLVAQRPIGVHWPNDVFVSDRKLAGILVEALPDGKHIVGIGCNVNNSLAEAPAELQKIVTSLADLTGRSQHRAAFLLELLERLQANLGTLAAAPESLGERANELCLQRGRRLTLQTGQCAGRGRPALHRNAPGEGARPSMRILASGVCAGIAPDGALLLETPTGLQTHYSGVLVHDA
ncbi:MAG TPA: biotin--[acetyl-CoA-carboxylase] ligase [Pirellulales bacterium]|nr:biotin--[acetyl-CoA-carboxylase] ligase [Pirellulales bacterium]